MQQQKHMVVVRKNFSLFLSRTVLSHAKLRIAKAGYIEVNFHSTEFVNIKMTHENNSISLDVVTQDDLKKYQELLLESKVEIDEEALVVITNLLRLNVSPDDICVVLRQIAPVCGLLKRFKIKPQKSTSVNNHHHNQQQHQ